jgi:hypothetical protein
MHGGRAARHARGLGEFLEGGVVVGPDRVAEPPGGLAVEGRGPAAAARLGCDRAGLPPPLQQLANPGDADGEAGGDLLAGGVADVAGRDDPLTEVDRVGFHSQGLLITPGITASTDTINRKPL